MPPEEDINIAKAMQVPTNRNRPFLEALAHLQTKFTALCAKLDADTGVTDTNYASVVDTSPKITKK